MSKSIEVEVRGLLTIEQRKKLLLFLKNHGEFKEQKRRISIDYSLFLDDGGIKNRSRDVRLRITNGKPEIIIKMGKWGAGENRKEISVMAEAGSFDKLVEIFAALGYKKGALCVRNSIVYDYDGIEFAVVEVPNHSYYFEAEKLVRSKQGAEKVYEEIEEICQKIGLIPFDDEKFMKYIEVLNSEVNEIFEFSNDKENYFKKRFGL